MNAGDTQISRVRAAGRLLWLTALTVCLAGAGYCWCSNAIDEAALRNLARSVSQYEAAPDDKALALLKFVHENGTTRRNGGTFGLSRWRATALQVAAEGGDCADKSRLLAALLTELGMRATPVLCFDAASGAPAHTMVEAELTRGTYMALDPAFGLWFPKAGGGYHDVLDLRGDPDMVPRRVAALQRGWGEGDAPDEYYLRAGAAYHTAATFHWQRGPIMRAAFYVMHALVGDEVFRVCRPRWIEEPKRKAFVVCLVCAGLVVILPVAVRLATARKRARGEGEWVDTSTHPVSAGAAVV